MAKKALDLAKAEKQEELTSARLAKAESELETMKSRAAVARKRKDELKKEVAGQDAEGEGKRKVRAMCQSKLARGHM